mmetsp:Transcript_3954/g.6393  ORF Transcript_3954/g.6393 Transcript_3954/m.6393 type:complete len:174 (+) Transcript_3954:182-703(+)
MKRSRQESSPSNFRRHDDNGESSEKQLAVPLNSNNRIEQQSEVKQGQEIQEEPEPLAAIENTLKAERSVCFRENMDDQALDILKDEVYICLDIHGLNHPDDLETASTVRMKNILGEYPMLEINGQIFTGKWETIKGAITLLEEVEMKEIKELEVVGEAAACINFKAMMQKKDR